MLFAHSRGLDSIDQYLRDVERYPPISSPEEERALARRAREGDQEATDRLVTAHLRFVISYVKKYQGRGLGLAELVSAGNEGLLKAVQRFDPDKGARFSHYAHWWVRATVERALPKQTHSDDTSLSETPDLTRLARLNNAFMKQLGRRPTEKELAREMGESVATIRALGRIAATQSSLAVPLGSGDRDNESLGELLSGPETNEIEDEVDPVARREYLERVFEGKLTERERRVLYLYYGLDDGEERTLEEVGSMLGVTRERIRQIRNRALEKLRGQEG